MALHRKFEALFSLQPDIAIVPECADLPTLQRKAEELIPDQAVWVGENKNKGLGVFAFNGYEVRLDPSYNTDYRIIAPIRVEGPISFNLLAAWSFNNRGEVGRKDQPGPVLRALDGYSDFCTERPLVVAGDFNNHVQWDKPGHANNQSNINQALSNRGLVSAYHAILNVEHGNEPKPTHYWRDRKKDGPSYHIDYIFVPERWANRASTIIIGSFEDWCGNGLSDHVPLVLEIDIED